MAKGKAQGKALFAWRQALRESELTPMARLVAYVLATYMDEEGLAWPSMVTLAKGSGTAASTVKAHMAELEKSGWVVVVKRGGSFGGVRSPNVYRAVMPTGTGDGPVRESESTGPGDDSNRSGRNHVTSQELVIEDASAACSECHIGLHEGLKRCHLDDPGIRCPQFHLRIVEAM